MPAGNYVYTVGHSNHEYEVFQELLHHVLIQVVVDVRSAPYSRYVPRFNKREIQEYLKKSGYTYLFIGDLIGGKPKDGDLLDLQGKADYAKIAASVNFQKGIDRIEKGFRAGWRIMLLCAEENPLNCHRHHLIGRELELKRGIPVMHVRKDGSLIAARDYIDTPPVQLNLSGIKME